MNDDLGELCEGLASLDDQRKESRGRQERKDRLDETCRHFSRELERLSVWHEAQQKAVKARFNVFTVLLKLHDEVRLHSRWLCYLLNPKAEHDCETLFLDLFIQTLRQGVQRHNDGDEGKVSFEKVEIFKGETAEVISEHRTEYGNIDIYIESPRWGIAIENKVGSGERENQIRDYAKYCEARFKTTGKNFFLLFLTLDGRQAQSAAKHEGKYYRISYRDHILPWLEKCLCATYPYVHINQALQQYKSAVNQLIGHTDDHAYMKQVIEIVKKHPSVIEYLADIKQAVEELRQHYWQEFVRELHIQLRERHVKLTEQGDPEGPLFIFTSSVFARGRHTELNLTTTLHYWREGNRLLIGEYLCPEDEGKMHMLQVTFKPVIDKLDETFSKGYHREPHSAWPLGWVEFWNGFNVESNKFLAENATQNSRPIAQQVKEVVEIIFEYLKVLEGAWPEGAETTKTNVAV